MVYGRLLRCRRIKYGRKKKWEKDWEEDWEEEEET